MFMNVEPGVKKSFPKLRIAESLTKEKSQILSFSTVYFRFSVPLDEANEAIINFGVFGYNLV